MKKVLKVAGITLLALVLVAAGFLVVRRQRAQSATAQAPAPTAVVTKGSIEETVSATGNVAAERQATLAFATSGEIVEVLVEEGQWVQAGEALARLDTTSLEWQVASTQAALNTAQAQLAQAQQPADAEDLASAKAALDSAIANREKVKEGASAEELASAQAALDSANASYKKVKAGPTADELAAAQAQVDSARASVQQAQAAYDRIKDQPDAAMRQESLNLQNATISLEQAQANYDNAANHPTASELSAAAAQVAQAEASLAALLERPTGSELASAASQVAQAQAQLGGLRDQPKPEMIAVYQAQVDQAAVSLAQAQSQLEDATLAAPFAGAILAVNVNSGEWASPGAPAIVLAAETMILEVNVDEVDVALLAEGQPAHLRFDSFKDESVVGTVAAIAPSSSNVSGAVAYAVDVRFEPGDLPIRLGMTADVDVVVARADDALLVPNRAVEADRAAGRYYVTRQNALGGTERVEVRIGLRDGDYTQIVEGVAEGDVLVLPTVPGQTESASPSLPFGGAGQQMRQLGGGN